MTRSVRHRCARTHRTAHSGLERLEERLTPASVYPEPIIATGTDAGAQPLVKVFNAVSGAEMYQFMAYDPSFLGGVRVALADLTGNGVPDIITVPGPGGPPLVRVFDGTTGTPLTGPLGGFLAYDSSFQGGLYVAAGAVDGGTTPDIVVAPDAGGGSLVKVFSGTTASLVTSFNAYGPGFESGVRLAVGSFNGNLPEQIAVAPGPGSVPMVHVIDPTTGRPIPGPLGNVMAYDGSFRGGVFVAAADVTGDNLADLITGAGAGHSPEVKVFSGADGSLLQDYEAFDPSSLTGVRVASAYIDGDADADVVAAQGPSSQPIVRVFSGATGMQLAPPMGSFQAYAAPYVNGVFVGAGNDPSMTVTLSPAAITVSAGQTVTFTVTWAGDTPPNPLSSFRSTFGFGDSSGLNGGATPGQTGTWIVSHTYTTPGIYYIALSAKSYLSVLIRD